MLSFTDWIVKCDQAKSVIAVAELAYDFMLSMDVPEGILISAWIRMRYRDARITKITTNISNRMYQFTSKALTQGLYQGIQLDVNELLELIKLQIVQLTQVPDNIDIRVNEYGILMLCIIKSIDLSCQKNPLLLRMLFENHYRLLKDSQHVSERELLQTRAYPVPYDFFHQNVRDALRKVNRDKNTLNNHLNSIYIVERPRSFLFPQIVRHDEELDLSNGLVVGISSIANTLYRSEEDKIINTHELVRFNIDYDKMLVPYVDSREELYNKYIQSLDGMINAGVHIAMYPEYALTQDLLQMIEEYFIINRRKVYSSQFSFLIAGTIRRSNDNILLFINKDGRLMGEYNKICPYVDNENREEKLVHPGKIVNVIDMPKLGRIIPSICLDYFTQKATPLLHTLLNPTFIAVCSHSESFENFYHEAETNAKYSHTITLYCNHCEGNNAKLIKCLYSKTCSSFICLPGKKSDGTQSPQIYSPSITEECSRKCHAKVCFAIYTIHTDKLNRDLCQSTNQILTPDTSVQLFMLDIQ